MASDRKNNQLDLLDILVIIARYKFILLVTVIIITVISLAISLAWPVMYKSSVTFLPPAQQRSLGGMGGLVGSITQMSFGGNDRISNESLIVILNSRTINEDVIHHFDLMTDFGTDNIEIALNKLNTRTTVTESREGGFGFNPIVAVQLSYTDKDPQKARDVTAYFTAKLDSAVIRINKHNSMQNLSLLETRYLENLELLTLAENSLKEFQETHGIFELETQTKSMIENIADLQARLIELDIERAVLNASLDQNNPQLKAVEIQRNEINRTLNQLVNQSDGMNADRFIAQVPAMRELPALGMTYMRLYREVMVQNKVFEVLYPQYVHSKVMLADTERGVQIIDPPHVPQYKDSPKRAMIVLAGFSFSVLLALMIILIKYVFSDEAGDSDFKTKLEIIRSEFMLKRGT